MDNLKNDNYYAEKAIEQINVINDYVKSKSYEDFICDNQLVDAVMFRLIQMIENIRKISTNFKTKNPQIPWGKIIGFRNGIVHEYGKTDYTIVYEVITENLNQLKEVLSSII
ncbi:MAG: DUF86 domain-containing protein [Bacilli bacterium]|nr:DUF86 domain-containing protein [Bacilli bacterium]